MIAKREIVALQCATQAFNQRPGCLPAFGDHDGIIIVDGLDNVEATAAALIGGASGSVRTKTTVLLTPEEVDEATKKQGNYRPPGQ